MDEKTLSGSDALSIQAMTDKNNGGFMSGDGLGLFFIFALLLMNNGNWGGPRGPIGVSEGELAASQAAQTTQLQMSNLLSGQQSNLFEIANMFSQQNLSMMQQNNTNLINAIQGFNNISQQIMNQTNVLGSKLDQLGYQMENCCCSIKTLIKDNQIADLTNQLNNANNVAVNSAQSQYLLSQMGKWVANAPAATA